MRIYIHQGVLVLLIWTLIVFAFQMEFNAAFKNITVCLNTYWSKTYPTQLAVGA